MKGTLGLQIKITNNITPTLNKVQQKLNKLPDEAYKVFVSETPIRSGNARRNTKFNKGKKEIKANYPYAQRLDEGYSKQSPKGMVEPTLEYIKNRFKKIMTGK